mmetsp:Transcript_31078/g.85090  ORF Transcript_31078/g.85090 Transcript_31078/m.85090 type:complete len:275 (-) Transcript_31078:613-1437(-)
MLHLRTNPSLQLSPSTCLIEIRRNATSSNPTSGIHGAAELIKVTRSGSWQNSRTACRSFVGRLPPRPCQASTRNCCRLAACIATSSKTSSATTSRAPQRTSHGIASASALGVSSWRRRPRWQKLTTCTKRPTGFSSSHFVTRSGTVRFPAPQSQRPRRLPTSRRRGTERPTRIICSLILTGSTTVRCLAPRTWRPQRLSRRSSKLGKMPRRSWPWRRRRRCLRQQSATSANALRLRLRGLRAWRQTRSPSATAWPTLMWLSTRPPNRSRFWRWR